MSACHSRDQLHEVEAGFDDEGRLLAFRDDFYVDCGAWNPIGSGIAYNTAVHLPGPYKFDHFSVRARIVATNKTPNAPYRGAGRPEATFAMERVMDLIARKLDLDPAEVRFRNMVAAAEMPYRLGIPYRDGEPIVYDSGDYPQSLQARVGRDWRAGQLSRPAACGARGRPSSWARDRLLRRRHRDRSVRGRDDPHRSHRQGLPRGRRVSAGSGHGNDLRADRRRCLENRSR